MMKSRLFLKIFTVYILILFIVLALDSLFVVSQTRQEISSQVRKELVMAGKTLLLMTIEKSIMNIQALSETLQARITITDAAGKVLADSDRNPRDLENHVNRPEIQEARVKGQGSAIRYSQTLGIDMMYVALPVQEGRQISGYIRLAKPLQEVTTAVHQQYRIVIRAALIILTSFLLLALFFLPKLISPLLHIAAYTEKVRGKEVTGPLLIKSRDEIGQLADNINLMVQSYEDNIRIAREERSKLASVFESMVEGIVIINQENRIEMANRALFIMTGDNPDIVGKTVLEAFRNVDLQNALMNCRDTGQPFAQEILLDGNDPKILQANIALIGDLPGGVPKYVIVFHDLTQVRKLERVRTDFVGNVTHEIKTPLTAIIGFVETLQHGAIDDHAQAQRFLGIIHENALRLNRLVDDLLILSSIELGKAKLWQESLFMTDVVTEALTLVEAKAAAMGLSINNDLPNNLPPILADKDSLMQIMVNVLDNAVKFTPAGTITIALAPTEKDHLGIMITDTGIGIPPQEIPRLGERFYRVDKMRSREMGGTGLGLSIVKHLMIAQKGWMEITSTVGRGTTVSLFFPLTKNHKTND